MDGVVERSVPPEDVPHPSVFILEEMEERGWSRDELAMRMVANSDDSYGIVRLALDMYLDVGPDEPGMRIGPRCTQQFARAFGTSTELWANLEAAWVRAHPPTPAQEAGS